MKLLTYIFLIYFSCCALTGFSVPKTSFLLTAYQQEEDADHEDADIFKLKQVPLLTISISNHIIYSPGEHQAGSFPFLYISPVLKQHLPPPDFS
ncbi:MAG: hypothetical protein U0T84_09625 [Chitinophagales bacterium]